MPVEGDIAAAARRVLPATWDALENDTQMAFGGSDALQATVDYVKETLFGTVILTALESALPRRVVQYAGKLVALELIQPGIEFWMNASMMESTTSPDETVTYANRAAELRALREILLDQTRREETSVIPLIPTYPTRRSIPRVNTPADQEYLTPSPFDMPRPFRLRTR